MRPSLLLSLCMMACGLTVPVESKLRRQKSVTRRRERGLQDNTSIQSYFSICFLTYGGAENVDLNLAAQTLATTYNNLATTSYSDPLERRMTTVEVLEVESRRNLSEDDEARNLQTTTQLRNLNVFLRVTGTCRGCASRTRFTNQVQRRRRRRLKSTSKSTKDGGVPGGKGKGGGQFDSTTVTGRVDGTAGSAEPFPSFNGYPVVSGNTANYPVENAATQAPIQQSPGYVPGQPDYSATQAPIQQSPGYVPGQPDYSSTPPPVISSTIPPTASTIVAATQTPIPPLATSPAAPLVGTVAPSPPLVAAATAMPVPIPPLVAAATAMPVPMPTPVPTGILRDGSFSLTAGQSATAGQVATTVPPIVVEYPSSAPSAMPSGQPSSTPSSTPSAAPTPAQRSGTQVMPTVDGQYVAEGSASVVFQPIQTADPTVQTQTPGVQAVPTEEEFRVAYAQEIRRVECHIVDVTHLEEVLP